MVISATNSNTNNSNPSTRHHISKWAERCIFFGLGVVVAIGVLYGHNVHTSEQLKSSPVTESITFQPPPIPSKTKKKNSGRTLKQGKTKQQQTMNKNNFTINEKTEWTPAQHDLLKAAIKGQQNTQQDKQSQQQEQQQQQPQLQQIRKPKKMEPIRTRKKHEPLNIVLFYADDWTMKVLGKLDPVVKTPNIDRMADNGMLFTNNCVTTSVCWISRATLMTGVYYSRHLQYGPGQLNMFRTNPWNETLFPKLRQAGYFTGVFGKWHAPQPTKEMSMAFNAHELYYGQHWIDWYSKNGEMRHITDVNQEHAIHFLQDRPKDKKFALKVSFFATHAIDNQYPSYEPKNDTKRAHYPDSLFVQPPKTATEQHYNDLPRFMHGICEARTRWKRRFEPDYFQKNIKDLYSLATEVDAAVGAIIDELKSQGVYNETLLVFTTDNGNLHGEHGLAEKWFPFEESIRVPLVIEDPRMPKDNRGTFNDAWTLSVDLAPTLLGAANIEPSSFMQGRDIADLYLGHKNQNVDWRKEWYYEWNMGDPVNASGHREFNFIDAAQALINDEWKYIYWPQQDYEQLFHRSIDPYDEWDLIKKDNQQSKRNFTDPAGNIQTTQKIYLEMKRKFEILKRHVLAGYKV